MCCSHARRTRPRWTVLAAAQSTAPRPTSCAASTAWRARTSAQLTMHVAKWNLRAAPKRRTRTRRPRRTAMSSSAVPTRGAAPISLQAPATSRTRRSILTRTTTRRPPRRSTARRASARQARRAATTSRAAMTRADSLSSTWTGTMCTRAIYTRCSRASCRRRRCARRSRRPRLPRRRRLRPFVARSFRCVCTCPTLGASALRGRTSRVLRARSSRAARR